MGEGLPASRSTPEREDRSPTAPAATALVAFRV
jgi:hypothetical protein